MAEKQYVSLTGCGHGPTKLFQDGEKKVFESVVARSKTTMDIVYGYVDEDGEIEHLIKRINLTFESSDENSEKLFWDNE